MLFLCMLYNLNENCTFQWHIVAALSLDSSSVSASDQGWRPRSHTGLCPRRLSVCVHATILATWPAVPRGLWGGASAEGPWERPPLGLPSTSCLAGIPPQHTCGPRREGPPGSVRGSARLWSDSGCSPRTLVSGKLGGQSHPVCSPVTFARACDTAREGRRGAHVILQILKRHFFFLFYYFF